MKQKLLTIAIPTYNGSKTICNALDILLSQVDEKIEVIVSDNCSTDETSAMIREYQKSYPQIKYIRNEKNLGADGNFLQCMRLANGRYTMLLSDDDIIVEGAVDKIVRYLESHENVQLIYLDAVGFKNKYTGVDHCHRYKRFAPPLSEDLYLKDKEIFMHHAQRFWGFTSTFIWSTSRFQSIKEPEQYLGTYFLQNYIHIACSNRTNDLLGAVKGPCIAVGEYGIIGNYDTAEVEGVFYRKMMGAAVTAGYNRKQLARYYRWKLMHLCIRAIMKEKVARVKKTRFASIVTASKGLPGCRILLLVGYLLPRPICVLALRTYRMRKGVSAETYVNRPNE